MAGLCAQYMTYSVLVVDDDEEDFILLAAQIKHCHQEVKLTYASGGEEASQQLINGLHPNLIIIDVQMPRMEGYELLAWLTKSEYWRHIPVVIWTGDISDREVTRYYRAGANSLLLKQNALEDVDTFCKHWFKLVRLPQLVFDESI